MQVAEGFGCRAERISRPEELEAALKRAAGADGPYVLDILVDQETDCSMGLALDSIREFE